MIQRIQSETGCRVKVDSSKDRTDPQAMSDVTLTGDDDQIDSATVSHKLQSNQCVLTSSQEPRIKWLKMSFRLSSLSFSIIYELFHSSQTPPNEFK